jgi:hypothetical protein
MRLEQPGPLSIYHTAVRQSDGTWEVGRIDLSQTGNWFVKVVVSSTLREKPIVLYAPVVIEPRRLISAFGRRRIICSLIAAAVIACRPIHCIFHSQPFPEVW